MDFSISFHIPFPLIVISLLGILFVPLIYLWIIHHAKDPIDEKSLNATENENRQVKQFIQKIHELQIEKDK